MIKCELRLNILIAISNIIFIMNLCNDGPIKIIFLE